MAKKRATEPTAAEIVGLIVKALTDAVIVGGKQFSIHALDEWKVNLLKSVQRAQAGGLLWSVARPNVLQVAADMGRIAVILCADNNEVTKSRVNGAFSACKAHHACPSPGGQGSWCDF